MFFGSKKMIMRENTSSKDFLITQMNNELAGSLDLKKTLQNSLEGIIKKNKCSSCKCFF
ncbi:MAG: hypothetical protein CM15mP122_5730 [Bacteroidota bacterium]|nr:MAG: hypothetical protein CM15mP122_5730 [Bacteroidota bacterium]